MAQIDLTHVDTAAFLSNMQSLYGSLFRPSSATEDNARKYLVSETLAGASVERIIMHPTSVQLIFSETLNRGDLLAVMDLQLITGDGRYVFSCIDSYTEEQPGWGDNDSVYAGYICVDFSPV